MRTQRSRSHLDEDAFNQAIAAEVRALLARHQKTQADVARHLGMKPNAVSFRWKGKTAWSTAELILMCDWLEVDAAHVMGRAKADAIQRTDERRTLESMLTEQDKAEIDDARRQLRPKDETDGGRKGRRLKAQ